MQLRFRSVSFNALFLVVVSSIAASEITVEKRDLNGDGKAEIQLFKVDDVVTTRTYDRNGDGNPESVFVFGEVNGKRDVVELWWDRNSDGVFDSLHLVNPDGSQESWVRMAGPTRRFRYTETDYAAKIKTTAVTLELGVWVLDDVTTKPILDSELPPKGPVWSVQIAPNTKASFDATRRPIRVESTKDGVRITMEGFLTTSCLPRKTLIYAAKSSTSMTLHDQDHDGRYEFVDWTQLDKRERLSAHDRNGDGKYDWFRHKRSGRLYRLARDNDFDGLLDHVTGLPGGGSQVEFSGDSISDRSLPTVPIPAQEVADVVELLEKVRR